MSGVTDEAARAFADAFDDLEYRTAVAALPAIAYGDGYGWHVDQDALDAWNAVREKRRARDEREWQERRTLRGSVRVVCDGVVLHERDVETIIAAPCAPEQMAIAYAAQREEQGQ